MIRALAAVLLLAAAGGCAAGDAALSGTAAGEVPSPDAVRGQALAQARCGGCHAVSASGASPHPDAPAFRDVALRYPPHMLSEALVEGIVVGHPDMPQFEFSAREASDLVAHLEKLSSTGR